MQLTVAASILSSFVVFPCGSQRGSLMMGILYSKNIALLSLLMVVDFEGSWRCGGDNNLQLIQNLYRSSIIKTDRIRQAMLATDRAFYAPDRYYEDAPQPLGQGQTISAPHMHAAACEELSSAIPFERAKILDVGCGSGYLTAVLARIGGPTSRVWGIDYFPSLVRLSEENIRRDDPQLLDSGQVKLLHGSGWDGLPEEAPFDAIHVGAAAESLPMNLIQQLKKGGRMIIPVGPNGGRQELIQVDKTSDAGYSTQHLMYVQYVPLVKH